MQVLNMLASVECVLGIPNCKGCSKISYQGQLSRAAMLLGQSSAYIVGHVLQHLLPESAMIAK